ncbi:MAG: NTP transferase domain-containing protein [Thermoguttaceae bacterium]|nr:NTP transferase domain-containing protein [Thermoguttaceae bacterium]
MKSSPTRSESATADAANLYAVIMAGGAGTRLWPESRKARPKPFLPFAPNGSALVRATFDRLDGLVPPENRFVVAGRAFAALVAETLPELRRERTLLEPVGRNTAPCVAWAALEAMTLDPDATLVVLPADHWIRPDAAFREKIAEAARLVEEDPTRLVTLGVKPTEPSTAFGYIWQGKAIKTETGIEAFRVRRFAEKPILGAAKAFLASGEFLWNAGVFVWKARRILELIRDSGLDFPETLDAVAERIAACSRDGRRVDEDPRFIDAFSRATYVSIDLAALERAPNVVVLAADSFEWNDVGSFNALARLGIPSSATPDVVLCDSPNSVVRVSRRDDATTPDPRRNKLVAVGGVDGLRIVDAGAALVIANKRAPAAIANALDELRRRGASACCENSARDFLLNGGGCGERARDELGLEIFNPDKLEVEALVVRDEPPATERNLVVVAGFNGLLVVETADALMVAGRDVDSSVQNLVFELERQGMDAYL